MKRMILEETLWEIFVYISIGLGLTWYFREEIGNLINTLKKLRG